MSAKKGPNCYGDIMDFPYRPKAGHMSMGDRAAQFAAFDALTDHEAAGPDLPAAGAGFDKLGGKHTGEAILQD